MRSRREIYLEGGGGVVWTFDNRNDVANAGVRFVHIIFGRYRGARLILSRIETDDR